MRFLFGWELLQLFGQLTNRPTAHCGAAPSRGRRSSIPPIVRIPGDFDPRPRGSASRVASCPKALGAMWTGQRLAAKPEMEMPPSRRRTAASKVDQVAAGNRR